ncbi:MAG TPA: aminoacyl-tRNA hydrolase [Vicinamibacteria bacterium]|nr:aminoacyl-tRNA hydrolase [Vicinamibacteria bacterium]
MRLLVGLGNPGERYRRTRHNLGFMVVDQLLARAGGGSGCLEGEAWVQAARLADQDVLFVKPLTFMNRSGVAVAQLLDQHRLGPQDMLVMVDDAAIGFSEIRIRERGSHGGHNGLRSIIDVVASEDFPRLRLGIGPEEPPSDLAAYVLSDFPEEEVLVVQELVGRASDAVLCLLREGLPAAMSQFNGARPRR